MENIPDILQGIAALAWPIIVIIILISFHKNVTELLESAKSRKFTVKVAGNELTMEEVSEQQRTLITDIQKQIVELQKNVERLQPKAVVDETAGSERKLTESKQTTVNSVLWVDDNPRNNAFLIESLRDQGINVMTALSTEEGLAIFKSRKFDRVISDLVRREDGVRKSFAGFELARQMRAEDPEVPIVIYTSMPPSAATRQMAREAGATDITSSATALIKLLRIDSNPQSAA
jgi:CheY-like chemotaxis protein